MPTLLVVEDEDSFRQFMSLALHMEGYCVESVANGEAALQTLSDTIPDLIMLDLSMPNVNGWDVLRHIRTMPALKDVPVVVVTASADDDTRYRTARERVDALLVKPVSLDEILDVVQGLLP